VQVGHVEAESELGVRARQRHERSLGTPGAIEAVDDVQQVQRRNNRVEGQCA
jgi:hypothetical protein